jgi:hypothetical protein
MLITPFLAIQEPAILSWSHWKRDGKQAHKTGDTSSCRANHISYIQELETQKFRNIQGKIGRSRTIRSFGKAIAESRTALRTLLNSLFTDPFHNLAEQGNYAYRVKKENGKSIHM